MTTALSPATLKTVCQGCKAELELAPVGAQRPSSSRFRGTCAKCGTEMTVTDSEETVTKRKDVDWKRKPPEGDDGG